MTAARAFRRLDRRVARAEAALVDLHRDTLEVSAMVTDCAKCPFGPRRGPTCAECMTLALRERIAVARHEICEVCREEERLQGPCAAQGPLATELPSGPPRDRRPD